MTQSTLDGEYTATLDRIVSGLGVLLIEDGDRTVDERTVEADRLPDAADEGSVLRVTFENDEIVAVETRPDETAERRQTARKRFERLSKRPPKKDDDESGIRHDTGDG